MERPIRQFIVDGFRGDPQAMPVVEQLLENYFDRYLSTQMDRVRLDAQRAQADFLKQRPGVLSSLADASNPAHFEDPLRREHLTGLNKDIFKSPEDMVKFCKEQLCNDPSVREDISLMTEAWRQSAIIHIGQGRYDDVSRRLGGDLAAVYMDYRLSEMVIKKMVQEQAPQSTIDYVVRKAAEGSLFGLARSINRTPMQMRIDEEGEQLLAPGKGAKATAKALSVALDAPMTGALTSWGSLIGVGALEVGVELSQPVLKAQIQGKQRIMTVEQILSRAMYSTIDDVFEKMRNQKLDPVTEANVVNTLLPHMHNSPSSLLSSQGSTRRYASPNFGNEVEESVFILPKYVPRSRANKSNGPVFGVNSKPASNASDNVPTKGTTASRSSSSASSSVNGESVKGSEMTSKTNSGPSTGSRPSSSSSKVTENRPASSANSTSSKPLSSNQSPRNASSSQSPNTANTPMDQGEGRDNPKTKTNADKNTESTTKSTNADGRDELNSPHPSQMQTNPTQTQTNSNENTPQTPLAASEDEDRQMASQWAPLIGQFGIGNLKDVGTNLGLVLATLPDMLFGMFSKKDNNPEFSWSKNLMPIASLLLGFKFRNPLLKMLLVGYGGVGLIKNGMENISSPDRQNSELQPQSQQQLRFVPYAEQPLNPRIENLQINNNILVMDIDRVPYSVTLPQPVVMAYQSKSLPLSTLANAVLQKYDMAVRANAENNVNQGITRSNAEMDRSLSQHEAVTLK